MVPEPFLWPVEVLRGPRLAIWAPSWPSRGCRSRPARRPLHRQFDVCLQPRRPQAVVGVDRAGASGGATG
jgi:hypothetical protein